MNDLKSGVYSLCLALLMWLLAGCAGSSAPVPITQVVTSAPTPTQWVVMEIVTVTPVPPTPTSTLTPLPTGTPMPSPTLTASSSPTVTPTPTPLPEAVEIAVAQCDSVTYESGRPVWATGHLVVPAGQYGLNAWQYSIWLRSGLQTNSAKMSASIAGGQYPNSMYFDGNTPRFLDNQGQTLAWYESGGQTIYVTNRIVKVTGIWQGDCKMAIDRIDVVLR